MKISKVVLIGLAALSALMQNKAQADDNRWSSNGPYGARVFAIAIHPFNNQIIYIGTVENGIYKSTSGGADWFHLDNDTLYEAMRVIRIHPLGPDTVYASTAAAVFRSTDAGASWSHFGPPFAGEYRALAIHPKNPGIMMLGTWMLLYKTTDAGNNWTTTQIPDMVQDVDFDPADSNRVYLASQSALFGRSIYRSDDLGESWQCIHNDLDSLGIVQDMAVDPVDPQVIYLAEHSYMDSLPRCLSKTTNGGQHWLDITPLDLHRPFVYSVQVSPLDHNTVYICTTVDGVLKSTDAGISWQRKNNGLHIGEVKRLVVDSTTGILYLGTYWDGIYRSTNGGDNWEKISYHILQGECIDLAQNARNPDTLYTATPAGIYSSFDGAQTWSYVDLGLPSIEIGTGCIAIDPDPRYIYVGLYTQYYSSANGGFARSTNGGLTWEIIGDTLIRQRTAFELAVSYAADSTRRIFLASDSGLYYSDDIGSTWNICQGGLPVFTYYAVEVSPVDYNLIFAGSFFPSLFYKSIDRGDTWNRIDNIPSSVWTQFIKCDPSNRDIVYIDCGLNVGLYKSTDCGQSWFDSNNNLPRDEDYFEISGLDINPYNHDELYINSHNRGVFVSYDGGLGWHPFGDGLQFLGYSSTNIKINPIDTSKIVMSTFGGSAWSIHRTLPDGVDDPEIPKDVFLLSNYPNPFNSGTVITYAGISADKIEIYNINGQLVRTITTDGAKNGKVTWDGRNRAGEQLGSGVYFARAKSNSGLKTIKMVYMK